jgi:hypothetical protein
MAKSNKSLVNLATGKKPVVKKEEKVTKKLLTPEEERDLKAKETVNKLLSGADLTPPKEKKDELLEVEPEVKGNEWLQEQVSLLSSENVVLRNDLDVAKDSYARIFAENQRIKTGAGIADEGVLKSQVIKLFHELQSNYINMGKDQYTGDPNFRIIPGAFLNRLIQFFPFLQQEKRF